MQEGTYETWVERWKEKLQLWRLQRWALFWKNGKRKGDPPSDPPP